MFGNHWAKTYRQTQQTVALSSGEADSHGVVKVAAISVDRKDLMVDLGVDSGAQVNTDSSATKSIASRNGAGRVRHIEARELWIQDRVAMGELTTVKVKGENNVADGRTKLVERHKVEEHMKARGVVRKSGPRDFCHYLGDERGLVLVMSHLASECASLLEACR